MELKFLIIIYMIKYVSIYGERCTGTSYLENLIKLNFNTDITYKYGWKHFFGFNDLKDTDNVLFICITRNLTDWLNSLYRNKWHVPTELANNINNFLNLEWYSINDIHSSKKDNTEIMEDRNIYNKLRYKNIFELRHLKHKFLIEDLPKKVKNYIFIRYEDLLNNFINTMNKIKKKGLITKKINFPLNTTKYKSLDININDIKKINYIPDLLILNNNNLNLYYEKELKYYETIKNKLKDIKQYIKLEKYYKNNNKKIELYNKFIEHTKDKEELWFANYKIGLFNKNNNNIKDALFYWLNAYNYSQNKIENIYEIIKYYRINGKNKLSNIFYNIAKNILKNKINNNLIIDNDVYLYKLDYEYTIFAYYLNIKNIDKEIVNILNNCKDNTIINNLLQNIKFYKNILIANNKINLTTTFEYSIENENIKFYSSSSCLLQKNNKYYMIVRYVNYYLDNNGKYLYSDKYLITINKYLELDKNFKIITEKILPIDFNNKKYNGIEDIRIFNNTINNKILFIGTSLHSNNNIGINIGFLDTSNNLLISNEIKSNFTNNYCEKNWIYFNYNNSPHIIYKWFPLHICKNINNLLKIVEIKKMPYIFNYVRGSTCGFEYKNETWFICHIVSTKDNPRCYYHMLVVFNKNINFIRYSAPFNFDNYPIEYCLSLIINNENVIVNYSTMDRTTNIGFYNKKYIESLITNNYQL